MNATQRRKVEPIVIIDAPGRMRTVALNECCKTEGVVIVCDGGVDVVECWVCGKQWKEACV